MRKVKVYRFDYPLLIAYLLLLIIGLFVQFELNTTEESLLSFVKRQVMFDFISITIVFGLTYICSIDLIKKILPIGLISSIIALIVTINVAKKVNGARRFLYLFGFSIQPSVFAIFILILYSAQYIAGKQRFITSKERKIYGASKLKNLTIYYLDFIEQMKYLIFIIITVFLLILLQKHLSILILASINIFWLMWHGNVKFKILLPIVGVTLLTVISIVSFGSGYRMNRVQIFKKYNILSRKINHNNEEIDFVKEKLSGERQPRESLAALSVGKLKGTIGISKYRFLHEPKTDYVFAVIGERFGFLGTLLVFSIYIFIFFRTIFLSEKIFDLQTKLSVIGMVLMIFLNAMAHIGVSICAIPPTGVTLPFISAGGTAIIAYSMCLGIILALTSKRVNV